MIPLAEICLDESQAKSLPRTKTFKLDAFDVVEQLGQGRSSLASTTVELVLPVCNDCYYTVSVYVRAVWMSCNASVPLSLLILRLLMSRPLTAAVAITAFTFCALHRLYWRSPDSRDH